MDKDVLQIEIPEGYELDKENSTSFNVKFKKKKEGNEESKVRTWDDLITKEIPESSVFIKSDSDIEVYKVANDPLLFRQGDENVFIDKKHAKSALAMAQISQLLPYFGGAITDEEWVNKDMNKKCITRYGDNILMQNCILTYQLLTFHTIEQAEAFLKYNKQLVYDYLMLDLKEQI